MSYNSHISAHSTTNIQQYMSNTCTAHTHTNTNTSCSTVHMKQHFKLPENGAIYQISTTNLA